MAASVNLVAVRNKLLLTNSSMFIHAVHLLCLCGPLSFCFYSLKYSHYQKHRQLREMTLQWMWTSHLLSSRTLHLWVRLRLWGVDHKVKTFSTWNNLNLYANVIVFFFVFFLLLLDFFLEFDFYIKSNSGTI